MSIIVFLLLKVKGCFLKLHGWWAPTNNKHRIISFVCLLFIYLYLFFNANLSCSNVDAEKGNYRYMSLDFLTSPRLIVVNSFRSQIDFIV